MDEVGLSPATVCTICCLLQRVTERPTGCVCVCVCVAGALLDAVLRDVIAAVLAVVEWSVDDCVTLHRILTDTITAALRLFHRPPTLTPHHSDDDTDPAELRPRARVAAEARLQDTDPAELRPRALVAAEARVCQCVPVWQRYRELAGFFGRGLGEVAARWGDGGRGPLGAQLSAVELARLTVGVYEKTPRRDAFIARLAAAAAATPHS